MIARTIEFGGITFTDDLGPGWGFSDFTDWFGSTPDKAPINERAQGHGAQPVSRSLRSSKALTLKANFIGRTGSEVELAIDELTAVAAEGPVLLRVNYPNGSTWRWVTADVQADDHYGYPVGNVTVHMIARDPRRYSDGTGFASTAPPAPGGGETWPLGWPRVWPGNSTNGRLQLSNTGRAASPGVTFLLRGGFASALVTCVETGARIGFDLFVADGDYVEIDVAERQALYNGASDVSGWLSFREWQPVPARSTRSYQFDTTGAINKPTMEGRVFPAWW